MKLFCQKCKAEVDIIIRPSGPHLKAECPDGHYIKFMNADERKQLEDEEDEKYAT